MNLGFDVMEQRVVRVTGLQLVHQSQCVCSSVLVPEVNEVELVVGLAAHDRSVFASFDHLQQPAWRSPPGKRNNQRSNRIVAGAMSAY